MDVLQWSRHHRCFPGQGAFDLGRFLAHVLAAGYRGPLSLEVFNDVFRAADPRATAVDAMRSLLVLEGELPPAPTLGGYAFAEVAGEDIEPLLQGLGFALTGRHRTKPVHLWEQGRIRLVVNHGDEPRVAAVAVESADPERSIARAAQLAGAGARSHARAWARPTSPRSQRPTARRCSSARPTRAGSPTSCPRPSPDNGPLTSDRSPRAGAAVRHLRRGVAVLPRRAGAGRRRRRGDRLARRAAAQPRARSNGTCASRSTCRCCPTTDRPSCSTSRSPRPTSRRRSGARARRACRC